MWHFHQIERCIPHSKRWKEFNVETVRSDILDDKVEKAILGILSEENVNLIAKEVLKMFDKENSNYRLKEIEKEIRNTKRSINNLFELIADFGRDEDLVKKINDKKDYVESLERQRERELLKQKTVTFDEIKDCLMREIPTEKKVEKIIASMVQQVVIKPENEHKKIAININIDDVDDLIPAGEICSNVQGSPCGKLVHHQGLEPGTH